GALCLRAGARVTAVEPGATRAEASRRLGARVLAAASQTDALFDVVFEASGEPTLLDAALEHARFEGRVMVVSAYGNRRAPIALRPPRRARSPRHPPPPARPHPPPAPLPSSWPEQRRRIVRQPPSAPGAPGRSVLWYVRTRSEHVSRRMAY